MVDHANVLPLNAPRNAAPDDFTRRKFEWLDQVAADRSLSPHAEMRAQGRHKSAKVLPTYAKRTMRQVTVGAKKRRATRTEGGHLSE
jgi:hypothetical protein